MSQHASGEAAPNIPEGSGAPAAPPPPALNALPTVRTSLGPAEIVARLEVLARRGKLAGFRAPGRDALCEAACFGEPFDRVLRVHATGEGGGTVLRFTAPVLWKVPGIMIIVTLLTIWPGVWLTDSMMKTYFSWYTIETWWWYIPLTVVPLIWMVPRMVKKSELACRVSAAEQIAAIAGAVERA